MKRLTLSLLTFCAMALSCSAQHSPVSEAHALKPGSKVPDFSLVDQDGKTRTLAEFTAQGPLALVFYRSADW